jgi:hypothetical protein
MSRSHQLLVYTASSAVYKMQSCRGIHVSKHFIYSSQAYVVISNPYRGGEADSPPGSSPSGHIHCKPDLDRLQTRLYIEPCNLTDTAKDEAFGSLEASGPSTAFGGQVRATAPFA